MYERQAKYVTAMREARRNMRSVAPNAAEIIAIAARAKTAENQRFMDAIIDHATEIWNLAQPVKKF